MNGITYYRLKSDYPGDYTKGCALSGTEVDNNFYVLEGRDIKSIAVDDRDIVVKLMNGEYVTAKGALNFAKSEEVANMIVKAEFDKLNGVLKLTSSDGNVSRIEGFATNENTNFSVATDNTMCGDGLRNAPLGVSPLAKTGQYKPVKAIINIADGNSLPKCNVMLGDRYITCEDISDYGYLYDYRAVRNIACDLRKSGWRIPTKADWDDLLNAVEPCDCDKNHDKGDKNRFLGKWAGKLLKSKTMWEGCSCGDGDCCDEHHHHHDFDPHHHDHHPHHHDCECGEDVCFDYSDSPCFEEKECEQTYKCEKPCCDEHQGSDSYGFRVTPAGYADDGCNFGYFHERGAFWTATTDQNETKAYIKRFHYNKDSVYQDVIASTFHLSLRLVKDYDGRNYHEVEEIMDLEYPTLLLPSATKGKAIWMASNFACANNCYHPMLPNNGQGITRTRHFFINEWNGFKWIRNEIKQGETVTVEKAPMGKRMIEYRIMGNTLVSVNEMIHHDVMHDVIPFVKKVEEGLENKINHEHDERINVEHQIWDAIGKEAAAREDVDNQQWDALNQERDARERVDGQLWDGINKEATAREEVDNQQWDAINNEISVRKDVDAQMWDAINKEAAAREDVDNQQWDAINGEIAARTEVDTQMWDAINKEAAAREDVDNQQWEAINGEIAARTDVDTQMWDAIDKESKAREDVDNQQWTAINNEATAREDVDNQLWEGISKEAAAREDVDNQQWTAINNEASVREDVDNQQWEAINGEITAREDVDKQIWEGISKEAAAREDVDNQQWEAINGEIAARTDVDTQTWDAIAKEAAAREDVDNQQWEAINNEATIREKIDNEQWDAINQEREERIAKDEELNGKILTQEGTLFDGNTGELTLKSLAGTNDIKVQFAFNFGEF